MVLHVHIYMYKMWSVFVSPLFYSFSSDFGLHIFVLTPRIEVGICGREGKRFLCVNVNYMSLTVDLRMRAE